MIRETSPTLDGAMHNRAPNNCDPGSQHCMEAQRGILQPTSAEPGTGADALQRPLRFRFRTDLDAQTLWSTLEKARKQLPKGQPGLVVVRIPEGCVEKEGIQAIVDDAVGNVFRQSHRVVAVAMLWEEWHRTREGWNLVVSRFKECPNKKSGLYQSDIDDLLDVLGRASKPSWLSFHVFVEQIRSAS